MRKDRMSKEEIKSIITTIDAKKCKVSLAKNPDGPGFQIEMDSMDPQCHQSLKEVSTSLGKYGKRYLAKRIKTKNSEVKKVLKELDLSY